MLRRRMEVRSHRIVNWHLILNKICRICLIRCIFSLHVLKKLTSETRICKAIVDDLSLSHFLHIFKPIIDWTCSFLSMAHWRLDSRSTAAFESLSHTYWGKMVFFLRYPDRRLKKAWVLYSKLLDTGVVVKVWPILWDTCPSNQKIGIAILGTQSRSFILQLILPWVHSGNLGLILRSRKVLKTCVCKWDNLFALICVLSCYLGSSYIVVSSLGNLTSVELENLSLELVVFQSELSHLVLKLSVVFLIV